MKKQWILAVVLSLVLALMVGGSAFAIEYTEYDDTSADGPAVTTRGGEAPAVVVNGDFKSWDGGMPEAWSMAEDSHTGWDTGVHVANMDIAQVGDTADGRGLNNALGMFVRNTGGSGPFWAYASQKLNVTNPGYYWAQVHSSAWSNAQNHADQLYNSVAFYAISTEANPKDVPESEWRELTASNQVCLNGAQYCQVLGRHETVMVEDGAYMHLRAGHKFSYFNSWTVFAFDDISLTGTTDSAPVEDGFITDSDIRWDSQAPR